MDHQIRKVIVNNLVETIPEQVKIEVLLEMLRERRNASIDSAYRLAMALHELKLLTRLKELSLRHMADPQKKPGGEAG